MKLEAIAVLAGVALMTLACGGMGGGNYDNVGACKNYVQAMNDLECLDMKMNAGDMCSDMLDLSPCDLATYYNCMAESAKCNGDLPDLDGQQDCGTPTCG